MLVSQRSRDLDVNLQPRREEVRILQGMLRESNEVGRASATGRSTAREILRICQGRVEHNEFYPETIRGFKTALAPEDVIAVLNRL